MRRLRLAAVAIAAGLFTAGLGTTSPLAAATPPSPRINDTNFRASRIQLALESTDPSGQPLRVGSSTARLKAQVIGWKPLGGRTAAPRANVTVTFTVLAGPDAGLNSTAKTDSVGNARSSISNKSAPGTDVVQATYSDGMEIHKSARIFLGWQSSVAARSIRSPAQITVTPGCFQPAAAAFTTSNAFRVQPPSVKKAIAALPASESATITVEGENFNPFSSVLITFDAGLGGNPQSFEAGSDAFGHFKRDIVVKEPQEGIHLVRADDFKQREADTTYKIPCYMPSVALYPDIGPPGFVGMAIGTGFPPNTTFTALNWMSPNLPSPLCAVKNITQTDTNGTFECPVLVLYHDILGPRLFQVIVANPNGSNAGAAIEADAPFLVTPGREQPRDLVVRR